MPKTVTCVECQRVYAFKPELKGEDAKCKCGGRVELPDGTSPEDMPVQALPVSGSRVLIPKNEVAGECIRCHEELAPRAAVCQYCGFDQVARKVDPTKIVKRRAVVKDAGAPKTHFSFRPAGSGTTNIIIGLLSIAGGITFTKYIHDHPEFHRGPYFVAWLPMAFGVWRVIRGLGQFAMGE